MLILGIEGGATKTSAVLMNEAGSILARASGGVSNIKFLSARQLGSVFRSIQSKFYQSPDIVSICLAGAIAASDHRKIRAAASAVWRRAKCITATDRESALMAAFGRLEGIVVICGTGSSTFGMRNGRKAKCGGWGHLLGDHGSGYDIALRGLRSAIREYDRTGKLGPLARLCLQSLSCNSPEELVDWIQRSSKADIATVASVVFQAANSGDRSARQILREAACDLAESVFVVASRLRWKTPAVCLTGGVFANQPAFYSMARRLIRRGLSLSRVQRPKYDGAVGAALVAQSTPSCIEDRASSITPLRDVASSLTEQRNPRTIDIHKKTASQLFDVMMDEESRTIPAIRKKKREIVGCIEAIAAAFQRGGRLFYIGAGTSGRLGVLDASECPPTFSAPPEMVQGILSGGMRALYASVEAAEDDPEAGTAAVRNRGITRRDVVVGIAASGRTPFVLGALREAARLGAKAFFLTFNPKSTLPASRSAIRTIAVATGPEVITGSTRLKAGTATKLILNMLTTISMIRLGKVVSNLMIDVRPTNEKLRDRACRIVMALTGCKYQDAWARLTHANWNIKKALQNR